MVKVNVGGTIFETTKDTLCRAPLFKNLFDDVNDESVIFINRSAKLFTHVLALLIDNAYPYPKKYKNELDYYLIEYNDDSFHDKLTLLEEKMNKIDDKLDGIDKKIMVCFRDFISNNCCDDCGQEFIQNINECVVCRKGNICKQYENGHKCKTLCSDEDYCAWHLEQRTYKDKIYRWAGRDEF